MTDFKKPSKVNNKSWFDPESDCVLIEQSIAKQYGVLPSEQGDLHYSDWAKLVSGLMEDTPLGRIVAIRSESDPKIIRKFTPEQKRIRLEWIRSQTTADKDVRQEMKNLQAVIAGLFSK